MYTISWPNRITILRILLIVPFVWTMLHLRDPAWGHSARYACLIVFALMAFSDLLDGYLARRLGQESAVGRFLDPLADKLVVFFSVILLALESTHVEGMRLPDFVAVIAIAKDLIVVFGFGIIYIATSKLYIRPQRVGKLCTTVQLAMVIAILLSPNFPEPLKVIPVILWWAATVLAVATTVSYFRLGRNFLAEHVDEEKLSASTLHDPPKRSHS